MELEKKDRILLINQYRILASLNPAEADYYNELIEVLERGYSIFYSMVDEWISDDMPEDDGRFVINILNLYRAIEDVKRRAAGNSPLNDHHFSHFRGFDGNNETKYLSFARFLLETQGKFIEQEKYLSQNDHMNSHAPMEQKYRKMLAAAENISDIWSMTDEEALSILDA